jgi:small-conductance mechanosensitive channel
MLAMLAATGLVLVAAFGWLAATGTPMDGHFVAAVAIAVAASLMLSAALMGLMFLSSRLGVDDAVWRDERPGARRR